ncbi:MAG: tail tape measure protein [Pseudomonadota bacterium]
MDDNIEELVVEVRAATDGLTNDLGNVRGAIDNTLIDGFERAGGVLERGLLSALRRGSLGFDDLKNVAFRALDQIAAHTIRAGIGSLFGGSPSGVGGIFGQALGAVFGLPGRATGGPVGPGNSYLVGERGPEVFVPTSSGRIEPNIGPGATSRDVRVAIQVATPRGTNAPTAMQRSSRQVASAVRRALQSS